MYTKTEPDKKILSPDDLYRKEIADTIRPYLQELKNRYPDVQYLTLSLKQLYGYSSLRVYTKKDQTEPDQTDSDDPLSSPL
jgi:hypothetical protein